MKKIIIVIYMLLLAAPVWAQTGLSARGLGMSGAYQGLARGAEVSLWNPANLGFPDNPRLSFDLLGVGFTLGNNSLNLSAYNQYFSQDYFEANGSWDASAKSAILGFIPENGFGGFGNLQVTAVAASYRQYALAIRTFAYSNLHLPQNLIAIPLMGLGTDPMALTEIGGEAVLGTEVALSHGREFNLNWNKIQHFYAGATVRVLLGHGYAHLEEAGGSLLSNDDSIAVNGNYRAVMAGLFSDEGGMGLGMGLDLGAAAQVNDQLSVGLKLSNLIGGIKFGQTKVSQGNYAFNQPGLNIDEFGNLGEYLDSVAIQTDTTFSSSRGVSYSLPKALTLSGTYQAFARMVVELDYYQGLNKTAGHSTTPLIALGTEYRYFDFLPTRVGIALGGQQGATYALGLGLDFQHYRLDLALANQRGLFNGSKGLSFALSQRLTF